MTALVLILFTYWFAVADRYRVFLYDHDMGPLYADTSAFSGVTSSRYWMAGLVAAGFVLVLYTAAAWFFGRSSARYRSPAGWLVWMLCVPALLMGIPAITMSANQPTLPLALALQTALVALVGLAFALAPGPLAAREPGELAWLVLDGGAMALIMSSAIGLEEMSRWLEDGAGWRVAMLLAIMLIGVAGLVCVTALRVWRRTPVPRARTLFIAGCTVAYLLLPLLHHTIGTNGYFYITDSDNFFAGNVVIQFLIWAGAGAMALAITTVRNHLAMRYSDVASRGDDA